LVHYGCDVCIICRIFDDNVGIGSWEMKIRDWRIKYRFLFRI